MSLYRTVLLSVLTVQRSGSAIILHEAGHAYSTGMAVLFGEMLKQLICAVISCYHIYNEGDARLPFSKAMTSKRTSLSFKDAQETWRCFLSQAINKNAWRVIFPAVLYVCQNNLFLYSSGRLQPSTFQALWQLRLIPTAYLSQVMCDKIIATRQWLALLTILGGVMMIQNGHGSKLPSIDSLDNKTQLMATAALMLAAVIASLAGVYLEKLFKEEETDLWIANFQLSTFSLMPAVVLVLFECTERKQVLDPFIPFLHSYWPWLTVLIQGTGGVIVALTTRYAGCIAGTISGIASIALTHLLAGFSQKDFYNPKQEMTFFSGFALISVGVGCYNYFSGDSRRYKEIASYSSMQEVTAKMPLFEVDASENLGEHRAKNSVSSLPPSTISSNMSTLELEKLDIFRKTDMSYGEDQSKLVLQEA